MGTSSAKYTECGARIEGYYRYRLWRSWCTPLLHGVDRNNIHRGRALFVMLNPSTADAELDDPTIRKCVGAAKRWGYCSLDVVNLYALRATDPNELSLVQDPVGPDNDVVIHDAALGAPLIVCAWGSHPMGVATGRATAVVDLLQRARPKFDLHCFGRGTKSGAPLHPARVAYPKEPHVFLRLSWL